jgi:geranylgeranyl pyrophosphate synthase
VSDSGALQQARDLARRFTSRARREIATLPEGESRSDLIGVTENLLTRTY